MFLPFLATWRDGLDSSSKESRPIETLDLDGIVGIAWMGHDGAATAFLSRCCANIERWSVEVDDMFILFLFGRRNVGFLKCSYKEVRFACMQERGKDTQRFPTSKFSGK